ncbi:Glycosyltransferase [hydrothermal vent metagenome]|uniref:Glycosyltransferase n=1 Tax=hydrothermal vent metagenome TaxID=652676 RepID=A0A1W1BI14_9ZZZZ
MKILLLFSGDGIGGAEKSLTRMVSNNSDENITYQVATFSQVGDWSKWAESLNLNPICFKFSFYSLVKTIRKKEFDIIYIIGFRLAVYLRFLRVFFPKIKLIQGVRWNPASESKLDKYFRFVERYFSYFLDGFITNSKIAKQQLINLGIKNNKIEVIYNGFEINSSFKNDFVRKKQVITVANLSERKGHIAYLSSIKNVLEKHSDTQFLFVGRDDSNGLVERKIKQMNLEKNVFCLGFRDDIPELLQQSSVFVLPSKYGEGCPTSILEAFACKLPVIAYAVDGIVELVDDGKDGFLCDKNNIETMSQSIIELLENPKKAQQFAELGYKKVKENFTIKNMLDKHNNFFKRC